MKKNTNAITLHAKDKHTHRILLFLLFSVILLSFFSPVCFATDPDIRADNLALCETRAKELEQQLEAYRSIDESVGDQYTQSVVSAVNRYRKQLIDLQSHAEIGTRSLKKEIELAYLRGTVAGKLTWIYVTNASVAVSEQESRVFLSAYEEMIKQLDATAELTQASADSFARDLNVAIYSERIRSLAQEQDSLRTGAILAGAIEEVRALGSGELSGDTYRAILEKARADALLQRHRDALYDDFCAFYLLTDPNGKPQNDEISALLLHRLSESTTLSDMNSAVKQAADALLNRYGTETHKTRYINTLKERIAREIAAAQSAGRRSMISALEQDFSHRYAIADAKDQAEATAKQNPYYPSTELTILVAEYTADGGILDCCTTANTLTFELWRAALRMDWLAQATAAKEDIRSILSPYDPSTLCGKVDSERSAIDARICAISASAADAHTSCTEAVNSGKTTLSSILIDAEAEAFRLCHIQMIEKPQGSLTAQDQESLIIAIKDWQALSSEAKKRTQSAADGLRESYRAVVRLMILGTSRSDEAESQRKSNIDKLCEKLSALTEADPSKLCQAADALLTRAKSIAALLDHYAEILRKSDYIKYDEKYKTELTQAAEAGCLAMQGIASDAEPLTNELESILTRSQLAMVKSDALARIVLAAENSTASEITSAVRIAEAKIRVATEESTVLSLADGCILTVRRVLLVEDAEALKDKMAQELNAFIYLSAEQKNAFLTRTAEKLTSACASMIAASDLGALNLAYTTFTIEWEGLLKEASEADLTVCRQKGRDQLTEWIRLAKEELERMNDPEEEIKLQFRTDLEALLTEYIAKINLAKDTEAVSALLVEVQEKAQTVIRDARLYKIRQQRAEQLAALKTTYAPALYSPASYEKILSILTELEAELEKRETTAEDESLLKIAKEKLSLIPNLLVEAKATATSRLQEEKNRLMAFASAYSASAKTSITEIAERALSAINEITEIPNHTKILELADASIAAMRSVGRDLLFNGPSDLQNSAYPADFDHQKNGLWGVIRQNGSIPFDSTFRILYLAKTNDDFYNMITSATDHDILTDATGSKLSSSMQKRLKKAELLLALDLDTDLPATVYPYRVELLLPREIDRSDVLGVVWFGADGSAEYYKCTVDNSILSFETTHFSDFYIVTKNTINLLPVIIFVSFLILCELIMLLLLLYRRGRRVKEAERTIPKDDTPTLPFSASAFLPLTAFPLPSVLQRFKPEHGGGLLILLSGTAVLLGVAIAILTKEELAFLRGKNSQKDKKEKAKKNLLPSAQRLALPQRNAEATITKDSAEMISNTESLRQSAAGTIALVEEEVESGDILAANLDGKPKKVSTPPEAPSDAFDHAESDEVWVELNLDVLARHFSAGDCITPELLKQMGLISNNVTHLKILARGRLMIPLFISAQEFSSAAVRAIRKAGGRAYKIR